MSEQFFSEDGCDEWLAKSGLLPDTGVYVDAGCAHPFKYSMTAFLRNRGWTGLAIDGNPAYAPEWEGVANAKFVHALLSDKPTEKFLIEPTNALVSRVHEQGKSTEAFTIRELLHSRWGEDDVTFLALDLEGMEAAVLADFLRHFTASGRPKIIVSEFNSCHAGRDVRIFNNMAKTEYRLAHMTESNAVFVR